jgi:pimeloyl-ACP methyl ester carboxylesterase
MIVMRSSPLRPGVSASASPAVFPPVREAVLLPGSGSDEVFVRAAFAAPLGALGIEVHAPAPEPGAGVVRAQLAALDRAVGRRPGASVLVGGVSLGGQVAAAWAARHAPDAVAGVLVALPAWSGEPGSAPAALAASASAAALRADGLAGTLAGLTGSVPGWLGAELTRAWTRYGPGLADSLDVTAATPGPTETELAGLAVPLGVAGLSDDPVHPVAVARRWAALPARAALVTSTLAALGRDRESLGRAAVLAWLRAAGSPPAR